MPFRTSIWRSVAAACTVAAVAAPAAVAKPADLRSAPGVRTSSLAGTSSPAWADPGPLGGSAQPDGAGSGTPWEEIGLGLAGACIVVAGVTGAGAARIRSRRSRVAV